MAPSLRSLLASSLFLASAVQGASIKKCRDSAAPVVAVKNGSYSGTHSNEYNQDYFLGMPYAQPPVRFSPSEPLDATWNETRKATVYPKHCVGYGGDQIGFEVSEDCLYLNVVRPAGINNTAGLPVALWIHGGGLFMGGSADPRYNLSFIVQNSVELGTPVIGVSINYRLSAFGFVSSEEALTAGVANLGFRDQRLAIRWVSENIAAFGGSPDKVTIFGESSGAESVSAQVLAYGGQHDGLFRAAAGESGFGGTLYRYPGGFNNTAAAQSVFDRLVKNTTCASTLHTPASLECLRNLSFEEINAAVNGTGPWPPAIDGDFIADHPHNQLRDGKFPKIPLLIGANTDEGVGFGGGKGINGTGANTDAEVEAAFRQTIPANAVNTTGKSINELVAEALNAYPNIQAVGIPGLDKTPAIQPGDALARSMGLQGRRTQAYFGDLYMHYTRRRANIAWANYGVPSYSYRFDVTVNPLPPSAGAVHFQEVAFVFDNVRGDGYAVPPIVDEAGRALAKTMSRAWVNFVAVLDPNGASGSNGVEWPVYDPKVGGGVGQNIVYAVTGNGTYVEIDAYRAEAINWLIANGLTVFGN